MLIAKENELDELPYEVYTKYYQPIQLHVVRLSIKFYSKTGMDIFKLDERFGTICL